MLFEQLSEVLGHGFITINKIDVDSIENRGRYVSKYFDKDLELKEHKKKAFFKSRNLKEPKVTKQLVDTPFDTSDQEIIYTSDYIIKRPIFFNDKENGKKCMDFQESIVRYTKIKNNSAWANQ